MSIADPSDQRGGCEERTRNEADKRDDARCPPWQEEEGEREKEQMESRMEHAGEAGKVSFIGTLESETRETVCCAREFTGHGYRWLTGIRVANERERREMISPLSDVSTSIERSRPVTSDRENDCRNGETNRPSPSLNLPPIYLAFALLSVSLFSSLIWFFRLLLYLASLPTRVGNERAPYNAAPRRSGRTCVDCTRDHAFTVKISPFHAFIFVGHGSAPWRLLSAINRSVLTFSSPSGRVANDTLVSDVVQMPAMHFTRRSVKQVIKYMYVVYRFLSL